MDGLKLQYTYIVNYMNYKIESYNIRFVNKAKTDLSIRMVANVQVRKL